MHMVLWCLLWGIGDRRAHIQHRGRRNAVRVAPKQWIFTSKESAATTQLELANSLAEGCERQSP